MPSLKDLKNRISSVKSTRKITKAMQMVAAAKLKRAQDAATAARPYAERMASVLANLSASAGAGGPKLLTGTGEDKTHLIVVLTAERGLAGGFNTYVVKLAKQKIGELRAEGKTVKILTVGKKGREQLSRDYGDMFIDHIDLSGVKGGDFSESAISIGKMLPTAQQLIPASAPADAETVDLGNALYIYEPSEEAILETLLPRYINTQILSAILESAAGEQASRMTAMDNATNNAGEMIDSLSLQYNRARQAQITKELIEIISGAEAL